MNATPLLDAIDWRAIERLVVLSPHMDDAALSCGGLLAALRDKVTCQVITICCADPPPYRAGRRLRSGRQRAGFTAPAQRRREDAAAMRALACDYVHLGFADAIYRRNGSSGDLIYREPLSHMDAPRRGDAAHVEEVYSVLRRLCDGLGGQLLLSPMGIGRHVDHQICAQVALRLAGAGTRLLFYEDIPYALGPDLSPAPDTREAAVQRLDCAETARFALPFDPRDKVALIQHYRSQIPLVFPGVADLAEALARRRFHGAPAEFYSALGSRRKRRLPTTRARSQRLAKQPRATGAGKGSGDASA